MIFDPLKFLKKFLGYRNDSKLVRPNSANFFMLLNKNVAKKSGNSLFAGPNFVFLLKSLIKNEIFAYTEHIRRSIKIIAACESD